MCICARTTARMWWYAGKKNKQHDPKIRRLEGVIATPKLLIKLYPILFFCYKYMYCVLFWAGLDLHTAVQVLCRPCTRSINNFLVITSCLLAFSSVATSPSFGNGLTLSRICAICEVFILLLLTRRFQQPEPSQLHILMLAPEAHLSRKRKISKFCEKKKKP